MLIVFFLKGGSEADRRALETIIREVRPSQLENPAVRKSITSLAKDVNVEVEFASRDCRRHRNWWTGTNGSGQ